MSSRRHRSTTDPWTKEADSHGVEPQQGRRIRRGMGVLLRITRIVLRHPVRMAMAVGAAILSAFFQLYIPQFLGQAVNGAHRLLAAGAADLAAEQALLTTAVLLLAVSVLRGLFTMLYNYQGEAVGQIMAYELRVAYYEKLQRLSFSFHDQVHSGDLMTRGMLDIDGVQLFVSSGLLRTIVLFILIGDGAYRLLSAHFLLGLIALSFVPFVGWRAIVTRLSLRESWLRLQERLSVLTRVMDENLSGIRVVRAFAAQRHEMKKFDEASARAYRLTRHRIGVSVRNTTLMTFAYFVSMLFVLWVGAREAMAGTLTVGDLTEFLAYMMILQMPVTQIGLMVNSYARASTCGARLFSVLDLEPEIRDVEEAPDLRLSEGVLRFEHVDFGFDHGERKILTDVSFELTPGKTIGIVGPPGAGKSTIAHLLARFYDVSGGRISIDGQDIREVSLESLRRAVNIVQQESFIFTAALDNNITYGDPWSESGRIETASGEAQLGGFIRTLPNGYGTLIGERGVSLSGGQRQRLAIARGMLLRPPIMVFDDSTASIDAATERRILTALDKLSGKTAMIIISHRLSTLMHADEILFIENGRIVERGRHEELLQRGGKYRSLYELQANRSDSELETGASQRKGDGD